MTLPNPVWPRCWAMDELLAEDPPNFDAAALQLAADWTLQDFLFRHRAYGDARLLPSLIRHGVYERVPSLEGQPRYWSALEYLQRIGEADPQQAGRVLGSLKTSNYAVLEQAVAVALTLDVSPRRLSAIVRPLTTQWLGATPNFFDAHLWIRLIATTATQAFSQELAPALLTHCAVIGGGYEFKLLLGGFQEHLSTQVFLETVESALLAVLPLRALQDHVWPLRDVAGDDDFPDESWSHLVRAWLATYRSAQRDAVRAGKLLGSSFSVIRQMGMRALGHALEGEVKSQYAVRLLSRLVADVDPRSDYYLRDELELVLMRHFPVLSREDRAAFVEKSTAQGRSSDKAERYVGRDALAAIREWLGPVEAQLLSELIAELGEPQIGGVSTLVTSWVGPESPISAQQMQHLSTSELVALMRFSPGPDPREHWGPSIEGLSVQLREEVPNRPADFLDAVAEGRESIPHPSVHAAVVDGLGRAIKAGNLDKPREVLAYFDALLDQFPAVDSPDESVRKSVGWALLDTTESFIETASDHLVALAVRLASDEAPSAPSDADWGGDLLTQGLNVVRGVGVRLALNVLLRHRDQLTEALQSTIEGTLIARCATEQYLAVLTPFGMYLRFIDSQLPNIWEAVKARLSDDVGGFAAIFGAFVSSNPSSPTDERMVQEYARAVELRESEASDYLNRTWGSVISHLVALHLFSREQAMWPGLVDTAMAAATSEERQRAVSMAGNALKRRDEDAAVDQSRLLGFVFQRVNAIRARKSDEREASALADLLIDANVPLDGGAGLLLDTMTLHGRPHGRDLLVYLQTQAPRMPHLAGLALSAYLRSGPDFWAWSVEIDAMTAVLQALTVDAAAARIGVTTVEWLASNRAFQCEGVARDLYRVAESPSPD